MNWKMMTKRFAGTLKSESDKRSECNRDYDRIVFDASFRRLAGKTQVFPMPKNDLVHTRLTHSLEASCIGRSLAGMALKGEEPDIKETGTWAVSAACLAHDIGNPPFGHGGEEAIQMFFQSPEGESYLGALSPRQRRDFQHFNGNAFGFHMLVDDLECAHGTLAAYSKYPNTSERPSGKNAKFSSLDYNSNKLGELSTDLELASLGPGAWKRSELAYLTEAADDIAYNILDLEDGVTQGLIRKEEALVLLGRITGEDLQSFQIERARGRVVEVLVTRCGEAFSDFKGNEINRAKECSGSPRLSLLDQLPKEKEALNAVRDLCDEKCYKSYEVTQIEVAAYEILGGLLRVFVPAFLHNFVNSREERIKRLLPNVVTADYSPYRQVLGAVKHVCSMTDRHAFETYQVLTGRSLPDSTRFRRAG